MRLLMTEGRCWRASSPPPPPPPPGPGTLIFQAAQWRRGAVCALLVSSRGMDRRGRARDALAAGAGALRAGLAANAG